MKAMLHGLPVPWITVDGHYEVGTIFSWDMDGVKTEYRVRECDPIGDNPETQLQNLYLEPVKEGVNDEV